MPDDIQLRPLSVADSEAMTAVLADPSLYEFTGGEPPTRDELTRRYAAQTRGQSPDGTERWVNLIVTLGPEHQPIGYAQATIPVNGHPAEIAWVIGRPWQGRGFGARAAALLLTHLAALGVDEVVAHIHPEHSASNAIARRVGLGPTTTIIEGERRWVGSTQTSKKGRTMQQLVVIFGPPAVGKMTVGRAIAARSGFRLFHNHAMLEPLLEVFDYGTPPFTRLLGSLRQQVIEEAAEAGTDLILTFVWGLELESDVDEVARHVEPYAERGARVSFVELSAGLDTRLDRNRTEARLADKRSKRDIEWSDANVRELERHVMNTDGRASNLPALALLRAHRHLRLDNTDLPPEHAAERILTWLGETG